MLIGTESILYSCTGRIRYAKSGPGTRHEGAGTDPRTAQIRVAKPKRGRSRASQQWSPVTRTIQNTPVQQQQQQQQQPG